MSPSFIPTNIRALVERKPSCVLFKLVVSPTIQHVGVGRFESHPAVDDLGVARFLGAFLPGDQLGNVGRLSTHRGKAFQLQSRFIVTLVDTCIAMNKSEHCLPFSKILFY